MKKLVSVLITTAIAIVMAISITVASPGQATEVKITPLGSHDGEFCARDRALIFEDPNGTRILYDVGRTVAGGEDERWVISMWFY